MDTVVNECYCPRLIMSIYLISSLEGMCDNEHLSYMKALLVFKL